MCSSILQELLRTGVAELCYDAEEAARRLCDTDERHDVGVVHRRQDQDLARNELVALPTWACSHFERHLVDHMWRQRNNVVSETRAWYVLLGIDRRGTRVGTHLLDGHRSAAP
jgi:hypothetical protein